MRFHLPPEMDTAFTWVDRSDNRGDACRKFRFQSSGLPVEMESGFFHTEPSPDSIQRMTVIHHEYEEWMDSIQPSISKQAEVHFNMNSAEINDFKAEYDSVSISGVPFLKIEMERQGMRQLEYVCFTPLIYIRVESNLEDDAAFFDEIMDTIERARITSG
ncbi:MAG: hypothetical protein HWD92_04960 [Flavobacteriia bacterium]|nr:hypothetical protein [Flavobacteriia bacterium]